MTGTTTDVEWQPYARQLADELATAGKLTDPCLAEAVRGIPRHVFVPTYHQQAPDGRWTQHTSVDNLAAVYANTALITDTAAGTTVLSSSTQPGLMTRMIEALHLTDGMRVLEIGTGTGYNAALLAHRIGDKQVFSVDVEPTFVDLARRRLAALGYHPTLVAADGAVGLPEQAGYHTTNLDPNTPWTSLLVWFLASFDLGDEIAYGYTVSNKGDTAPTASWIATPDGSWAEITLAAQDGGHSVAEVAPAISGDSSNRRTTPGLNSANPAGNASDSPSPHRPNRLVRPTWQRVHLAAHPTLTSKGRTRGSSSYAM